MRHHRRLVLLALAGVAAAGAVAAAAVAWRPEPLVVGAAAVGAGALASLATLGRAALSARRTLAALINLVKNAHESGSPAGAIAVSVQPAADGGFLIRVMDRGRGMREEELTRALVPYYTSKPSGTGLGLPLSSEIFAAHGGRLVVANREGGGLVVTCRLSSPT
jgi:signal transduction histidine kinase